MRFNSPFHILFLWGQFTVGHGFEVRMVIEPVAAIRDQTLVLGCSFTVTRDSPEENIIVTWQLVHTAEVVHSYYYGEDQLSQQNPRYSGRTCLFPEEFKNGNASLKLKGVIPNDAGLYQCYVSNTSGTHKETVSVSIAAYYSEPVLLIKPKLSSTILTFESRGFPKADVSWYNGDNLQDSLLSSCSYQQTADGLYIVESTMEISVTVTSNYTFVLRNAAVNQTISRTFHFFIPENSIGKNELSCNYSAALVSCILGAILLLMMMLTVTLHKHRYIKPKKMEYNNSGPP